MAARSARKNIFWVVIAVVAIALIFPGIVERILPGWTEKTEPVRALFAHSFEEWAKSARTGSVFSVQPGKIRSTMPGKISAMATTAITTQKMFLRALRAAIVQLFGMVRSAAPP